MLVGYNHNFRYKGVLYHVQTEDSGAKNPHIVTLLFHGGTILASHKTPYADILSIDRLEQIVEEMMKDQHRAMLRRLKNGEFDDLIRERLDPAALEEIPGDAAASPVRAPALGAAPSREPTLEELILSYFLGDQAPT